MENNNTDNRFTQVEEDKQAALQKTDAVYGDLIDRTEQNYEALIDEAQDYEQAQIRQQEEQTELAIGQIQQQKEQTQKDYTKEQSAAYTDYQKQTNTYGANAEAMAAGGLTGSGYSESSRVSMYNTYQNRVAVARESYQQAVRDYENAIQEARNLNSSALAQIAYEAFQTQTKLTLEYMERTGQLKLDWADKQEQIEELYYGRKQDVQDQINMENALAEEKRQYDLANSGKIQDYEARLQAYAQQNQEYAAQNKANAEWIRQLQAQLAELLAAREGNTAAPERALPGSAAVEDRTGMVDMDGMLSDQAARISVYEDRPQNTPQSSRRELLRPQAVLHAMK